MTTDERLERVCREMCKEDGIPESEWRIFRDTFAAQNRVLVQAWNDLMREVRAVTPNWLKRIYGID